MAVDGSVKLVGTSKYICSRTFSYLSLFHVLKDILLASSGWRVNFVDFFVFKLW